MIKLKSYISHKFSYWNRRKKAKFVQKYIAEHEIATCLIVGASPLLQGSASFTNLVEKSILEKLGSGVTFSGLETNGGDWPNWVMANGLDLPFPDGSFDLVFSNAVIEHVGLQQNQERFLQEHARVGKHWIITTPNRLFPVESHTQILFSHMKPGWSHPLVTRLLSMQELNSLLVPPAKIKGHSFSPTFIAFKNTNFKN